MDPKKPQNGTMRTDITYVLLRDNPIATDLASTKTNPAQRLTEAALESASKKAIWNAQEASLTDKVTGITYLENMGLIESLDKKFMEGFSIQVPCEVRQFTLSQITGFSKKESELSDDEKRLIGNVYLSLVSHTNPRCISTKEGKYVLWENRLPLGGRMTKKDEHLFTLYRGLNFQQNRKGKIEYSWYLQSGLYLPKVDPATIKK